MDTQSIILLGAVLVRLAVIYWVDDGRIRVGVVALLGGLLFWSLMTALSGTARSFASLATYRIGVGIYYLWPWLLGASVLSTHARRQRQ